MNETENLIDRIRMEQVLAGEKIVMRGLVTKGLMSIGEFEETTGEKFDQEQGS